MSEVISYPHELIDDARASIAATATSMNGLLGDLKREVQALVSTWNSGAATEAYQVQQQKWDQSAASLNEILDAIGRATGNGNDDMRATDKRAAASWQ